MVFFFFFHSFFFFFFFFFFCYFMVSLRKNAYIVLSSLKPSFIQQNWGLHGCTLIFFISA